MRFYPIIAYPWILLAIACGCVLLYSTYRHSKLFPVETRRHLIILRGISFALLIIALLNPGYVITETNATRSAFVYLVDNSSSMSTKDMPGNQSRSDAAQHALNELLKTAPTNIRSYIYTFNHLAQSISPTEPLANEIPNGDTQLTTAIATAERDIGDEAISTYILLTDGLDHSKYTGHAAGIPIHAVHIGTSLADTIDLRIDDISPTLSLSPGEQWDIEIPVTLSPKAPASQTYLTITVDGIEKLQKKLSLQPGETQSVAFSMTFKNPGLHHVTMGLSEIPNETSTVNNTRDYYLEVRDDELVPIIYFPVLNNSFRPLTRLFTKTGRKFASICRMRQRNFLIQGNSPIVPTLRAFPDDQNALNKIDLVILGSALATDYTDSEIKLLEEYVNQGGNIVFIGGPEAFIDTGSKTFTGLFPAVGTNDNFVNDTHAINCASSSRFRTLNRFTPSIKGLNQPGVIKASATILLTAGKAHHPLVLSMPYGRGQVVAILSNSLHLAGSSPNDCYQAFWENLLAYISSNRTSRLSLQMNGMLSANAPLSLRAHADGATAIEAELSSDNLDHPRHKTLSPSGKEFTATFTQLPTGMSTLRVTAQFSDAPAITRYYPIYCNASPVENDSLKSTRENFLRFTTDGRIYSPDNLEALRTELERLANASKNERLCRVIYERPYYALLVMIILMAEWALRRKHGLF